MALSFWSYMFVSVLVDKIHKVHKESFNVIEKIRMLFYKIMVFCNFKDVLKRLKL